jgi:signal transduction histidine kinase
MVTDLGRGTARIRRKDKPRIPRWLHTILGIPLEMKLLGANLIIVGVTVLLLFGPVGLQLARLTDAYVVVAALIVGATVNFGLVRLVIRPINAVERVAWLVSEGRLGVRVPTSIVADHELTQLSTTINEMLDSLAASREQMGKFGSEVVYAAERERAQVTRELYGAVNQMLAEAGFQIDAAAQEIGSHAGSSRLADVQRLLRTAREEIRNISRSVHPRVATDLELLPAPEVMRDARQHRSLLNVRPPSIFLESRIPDWEGVMVRPDIRDVESGTRVSNQR